eukprot:CAMPEP_0174975140 /NCGR_PEP_ID=MMETSP0004_2-20121128/12270_1 /TAXON_ID=420556 /ORGANISM="Ochromonas sp., Strain CCMP1393" /LENGTH=107 /DNA_ID=CAMNT_0016225943 /DNA_START=164 /DNA_END=487 /DNA_ORIENTATION=+
MTIPSVSRLYAGGSEFERDEFIARPNKIETAKETAEEEEEVSSPQPPQESAPRQEISNSMRDRLRAELRSQGADPNYSAGAVKGNPILIVSAVIALLVIAGGKDILY